MSHWEKGSQPSKGNAGIVELASLLARGYLRLLVARCQDPELAQDPASPDSPTVVQIGVDVAAEKMAQLPRGRAR